MGSPLISVILRSQDKPSLTVKSLWDQHIFKENESIRLFHIGVLSSLEIPISMSKWLVEVAKRPVSESHSPSTLSARRQAHVSASLSLDPAEGFIKEVIQPSYLSSL